jgi:hypothetical protein
MKLKLDANGNVVLVNGLPVYVHADGREIPFDAPAAMTRISEIQAEAKTHREAKEALEAKAAAYKDIADPAAAIAALALVKNIDDKKLVDAGKVEEIKRAATSAYEEKLKAAETAGAARAQELEARAKGLEAQLHAEIVGGSFARSKYIADKIAIPADLLQAKFGSHFAVNAAGKLVAKDGVGNQIFSQIKPGAEPEFDEAIEIIVNGYTNKAQILKGSGSQGSGSQGSGNNAGAGGKKTITRAAFEQLPAESRASALKDTVLVD